MMQMMVPEGPRQLRAQLAGRAWRGGRPARSAKERFRHRAALRRRKTAASCACAPELFADHYSQATLFWKSQTDLRAGAYRVVVRVRAVEGRISSIAAAHGRAICATSTKIWRSASPTGSASTLPKAAKPARAKVDMTPSAALSIQRTPRRRSKGRKIGVLIADGSDAKTLKTLQAVSGERRRQAVRRRPARAWPEAVRRRRCEGRRPACRLAFAAVRRGCAVCSTRRRRKALAQEGAAVKWVMDAFAHLKAIGADAGGEAVARQGGRRKGRGRLRSRPGVPGRRQDAAMGARAEACARSPESQAARRRLAAASRPPEHVERQPEHHHQRAEIFGAARALVEHQRRGGHARHRHQQRERRHRRRGIFGQQPRPQRVAEQRSAIGQRGDAERQFQGRMRERGASVAAGASRTRQRQHRQRRDEARPGDERDGIDAADPLADDIARAPAHGGRQRQHERPEARVAPARRRR